MNCRGRGDKYEYEYTPTSVYEDGKEEGREEGREREKEKKTLKFEMQLLSN